MYEYRARLSGFTTLGIGGEATIIELREESQVVEAVASSVAVLGRGSNVLVSDKPTTNKILINRMSGIVQDGERVIVKSGTSLPQLSAWCQKNGLSGMEWACGVPGSVGGAIKMNAGAFGKQMSDVVLSAEILTRIGERKIVDKEKLCLGYRTSGLTDNDFVLNVTLNLRQSDCLEIKNRMIELSKIRKVKQPQGRSAGSTYKASDKPAGWYIEQAGLKGYKIGGAQVSTKHANFIINTNDAKAVDVINLMKEIERQVFEKFGIMLQREIQIIGVIE